MTSGRERQGTHARWPYGLSQLLLAAARRVRAEGRGCEATASWLALGAALGACAAPSPRPVESGGATSTPSASAVSAGTCDGVDGCEADCHRGVLASCGRAAWLMREHPLAASLAQLVAVEDRACALGHGRSCVDLATLLDTGAALPPDPARVHSLSERACALGDGTGCFRLFDDPGSLDHQPDASEQDRAMLARIESLLQRGCDEHDARSCLALLAFVARGDRERFATLTRRTVDGFERACFLGAAEECRDGALQSRLLPDANAAQRSRRMIEHGCDLGSADCCAGLVPDRPVGGSAEDVRRLRWACQADSASSCAQLGLMILRNELPLTTHAEGRALTGHALALARAHCERGETNGCELLAWMLGAGQVTVADGASAIELLGTSCDRGMISSCAQLGAALNSERIPATLLDPARAANLKKRACRQGYSSSCPDPSAAFGLYPRLEATVIDRRARLAWEPVSPQPETLAEARRACVPPRRLPTRADLATLVGPDGELRRFARVTLPAHGALLSGELADEAADIPWTLDVLDGHLAEGDRRPAYRRCVADLPARTPPARPVLRLDLHGSSLDYVLRDATHRRRAEGTVSTGDVPGPLSLPGLDARSGVVDAVVDADADFGSVTRFLHGATLAGVTVRSVTLENAR